MNAVVSSETVSPKDSHVSVESVRYGGLIRRFIAFLLDVFVMTFIMTIIMFIPTILLTLVSIAIVETDFYNFDLLNAITTIMNLGGIWLYFSWFESSSSMATPGKMVMGLKVMDINGNRITFKRALLRIFFKFTLMYILTYFIPLIASIYWLGNILTRFTNAQRRCLHDFIAGTVVVRGYAQKQK